MSDTSSEESNVSSEEYESQTSSEEQSGSTSEESQEESSEEVSKEESSEQESDKEDDVSVKERKAVPTGSASRNAFDKLVTQLTALIIGLECIETETKFYSEDEIDPKFSHFAPAVSLAESLYRSLGSDASKFKDHAKKRIPVIKRLLTRIVANDIALFKDFVESPAVLILNNNVIQLEEESSPKKRKAKSKRIKLLSTTSLYKSTGGSDLITYKGKEFGSASVEIIADAMQRVVDERLGIGSYVAEIGTKSFEVLFNSIPISDEFSVAMSKIIRFISTHGNDKKKEMTFKAFRDKFHDKAFKKDRRGQMAYDRCLIEGLNRSSSGLDMANKIYTLYIQEVIPSVSSDERKIFICTFIGDFFSGVLPENYLDKGFAKKVKKLEKAGKIESNSIYSLLETLYSTIKKWIAKAKKSEDTGPMYSAIVKLSRYFKLEEYYKGSGKKTSDIYTDVFSVLSSGLKKDTSATRVSILRTVSEEFLEKIPPKALKKSADKNVFAKRVRKYLIPSLFVDLKKAPASQESEEYLVSVLSKCGLIELTSVSEFIQDNMFNEKVSIENRVIIIRAFSKLAETIPKKIKQYKSVFSTKIYHGLKYSQRGDNGLLWSGPASKEMKKLFTDNDLGMCTRLIAGYARTFPSIVHSEKAKKLETIERIVELSLSKDEELSDAARKSIYEYVSLNKRKNRGSYFSTVAGVLSKKVLEKYDWIFSAVIHKNSSPGALGSPSNVVLRMLQLVRSLYSALEEYISSSDEADVSKIKAENVAYLRARTESLLVLFSLYPDPELVAEIKRMVEFLGRKELLKIEREVLKNQKRPKKGVPDDVISVIKGGVDTNIKHYVRSFSALGPEHSWIWNNAGNLANHRAISKVLSKIYADGAAESDAMLEDSKTFVYKIFLLVNSIMLLPEGVEINKNTHKVQSSKDEKKTGGDDSDEESEESSSESSSSSDYGGGDAKREFHITDTKISYTILEKYFENLQGLLRSKNSILVDYIRLCTEGSSVQMLVAIYHILKSVSFSLEPKGRVGKIIPLFYTNPDVFDFLSRLLNADQDLPEEISRIVNDYFLVWINNKKSIFKNKERSVITRAMELLEKYIRFTSSLASSKNRQDISEEFPRSEEAEADEAEKPVDEVSKPSKKSMFRTITRKKGGKRSRKRKEITESSDSDDSDSDSDSEMSRSNTTISESQIRAELFSEFSLFRKSTRDGIYELCTHLIGGVVSIMDKEYKRRKKQLVKKYKDGIITKEEYLAVDPRIPEDKEEHSERIVMISSLLSVMTVLSGFRKIESENEQVKLVKVANAVLKFRPDLSTVTEEFVHTLLKNHGYEVLIYVCRSAVSFLPKSENYHVATCYLRSLRKFANETSLGFSSESLQACFTTGIIAALSLHREPRFFGSSLAVEAISKTNISKQDVSVIFGSDELDGVRRFFRNALKYGLNSNYVLKKLREWKDYLDPQTLGDVVLVLSPVVLDIIHSDSVDIKSTLQYLVEIGVECLDDDQDLDSFKSLLSSFVLNPKPDRLKNFGSWLGNVFDKVSEVLTSLEKKESEDGDSLKILTSLMSKLSQEDEDMSVEFLLSKIEEDYIVQEDLKNVSMGEFWKLLDSGSKLGEIRVARDAAYYLLDGIVNETPLIGYSERLARVMQSCLVLPDPSDSATRVFNRIKTTLKHIDFRPEDDVFLLLDESLRRSWSDVALRWLVSFFKKEKFVSEESFLVYSKTKIGGEISPKELELLSALLLYSLGRNVVITRSILKFFSDNSERISGTRGIGSVVASVYVCLSSNDEQVYKEAITFFDRVSSLRDAISQEWAGNSTRSSEDVLRVFFKGFFSDDSQFNATNLKIFGTFLDVVGRGGFVGDMMEKIYRGAEVASYSSEGLWYLCLYILTLMKSDCADKDSLLKQGLRYLLSAMRSESVRIDAAGYETLVSVLEYVSFNVDGSDEDAQNLVSDIFRELIQDKASGLSVGGGDGITLVSNVYQDSGKFSELVGAVKARISKKVSFSHQFDEEEFSVDKAEFEYVKTKLLQH